MPVCDEMIELVDHGAKGAVLREGADMGFEMTASCHGRPRQSAARHG